MKGARRFDPAKRVASQTSIKMVTIEHNFHRVRQQYVLGGMFVLISFHTNAYRVDEVFKAQLIPLAVCRDPRHASRSSVHSIVHSFCQRKRNNSAISEQTEWPVELNLFATDSRRVVQDVLGKYTVRFFAIDPKRTTFAKCANNTEQVRTGAGLNLSG